MRIRSFGFTLLEILIVLVILGILSGLAVPSLQAPVERGRAVEAYKNLDQTRQALARYYLKNDTYDGATIPPAGFNATLDFNPNEVSTGTNYFTYSFTSLNPTTYTVRAARQSFWGCGSSIGTITIDQAGGIVGTGAYI